MRVVLAHDNPEALEPVRQVLLGLGLECSAGDCVLFGDVPVRLAQGMPDLVLVRTASDQEAALDAIYHAVSLASVPVLALGPVTDAQHILQCTRSGAREYLDEDHLAEDLEAALEKLQVAAGTSGPGGVVSVLSVTPGGGVTTVATNLAFAWAQAHPDQVGLVELGHEPPDLASNLDLKPPYRLAEVCENWQRLDLTLLRKALVQHPDGVWLLGHQPETLGVGPCDPRAVRRLVVLLRALLAQSVLDLGHLLGEEHYEAMRLSDQVAVVVRLDAPALRQARRLLQELDERGIPREQVHLVANRYGQPGQIGWRKAEEVLGASFAEYIPEDSGKLNRSLFQGRPVVRFAPGAGISRRLSRLAKRLAGSRPALGPSAVVTPAANTGRG
jgi:pilus assembly protein CpaE